MFQSYLLFILKCSQLLAILSIYKSFAYSKYGIEKITAKNYEEKVLNSEKDARILIVKNVGKISLEELMEFEFRLRGLFIRVGIIDPQKDGAFLKRKGFLDNNNSYPLARVFPYGGWKVKVAGKKDVRTLKEAKKMALQSIPDETTKIHSDKELEHFVHSSYGTSPPRFPVILFSETRQTAALYKALSFKYPSYFNFGVMRKPSKDHLQKFSIKSLPGLVVMLATILPNKQLTFSSIQYDVRSYGEINYLNVAKFLYSVHQKHWKDLPNIKKFKGKMALKDDYIKDTKSILSMDANFEEKPRHKKIEIQEITPENYKHLCNDKTIGLCIIVFLDGNNENMKKETLQLMSDVENMMENEGHKEIPRQYLWVDGTCHPEYGDVFGIFPESLPTLLITRPRQRLFIIRTLKDAIVSDISKLVTRSLKGESKLQTYARFNDMLSTECLNRERNQKKEL